MSALVSIDPGLRACGVAVFDSQGLQRAALVPNGVARERGARAWIWMALAVDGWLRPHLDAALVVELPRVYPSAQQKGDQNDLIELAGVVGALVATLPAITRTTIYPREWKGTIDPDVMIERIKARLSADELARIDLPTPSLQHNVFDSVGIGLHALGRLEPRKVFPR